MRPCAHAPVRLFIRPRRLPPSPPPADSLARELDALRRKYRAEEIQEIFMKQSQSLQWDKNRKQFQVTRLLASEPACC
jgi:hypothetical protein